MRSNMDNIKMINESVLIGFYEAEPCLWNPLDPGYTDNDLRRNALQKILILGKIQDNGDNNVTALEKRFKRYVNKYVKELYKVNEDPLKAYKPRWEHYDRLDKFLNPLFQQKISTCPAKTNAAAKRPPPSQGAGPSSANGNTPSKKKTLNPSMSAAPETAPHARFGKHVATVLDSFDRDDAAAAVIEIQEVLIKYVTKV
ncbi:uncharacterized protein LOC101859262 [Aplysia californica]|uniref:Uncharacterized protein LOC101859262 n=1 Tax=Aplysia californica TaxID=6500 RepID=A0ABM0JYD9_APLCA|nr:uncharacterized protein LOC101859262 [Aplysia californica]